MEAPAPRLPQFPFERLGLTRGVRLAVRRARAPGQVRSVHRSHPPRDVVEIWGGALPSPPAWGVAPCTPGAAARRGATRWRLRLAEGLRSFALLDGEFPFAGRRRRWRWGMGALRRKVWEQAADELEDDYCINGIGNSIVVDIGVVVAEPVPK